MSSFTPTGGSGGLPITVSIDGVQTPTIANISVPLAATEQSYTFPANTKRFRIRARESGCKLQVAYVATSSGTIYETINSCAHLDEADIQIASITIYFQTTQPSQIVEITSWV